MYVINLARSDAFCTEVEEVDSIFNTRTLWAAGITSFLESPYILANIEMEKTLRKSRTNQRYFQIIVCWNLAHNCVETGYLFARSEVKVDLFGIESVVHVRDKDSDCPPLSGSSVAIMVQWSNFSSLVEDL